MTLRLILTRHAKSDWSSPGQPDHDRPLNARGRRQAPLIGAWLASRGVVPGEALVSDATRTAETAALILPGTGATVAATLVPRLYHADPDTMLAVLRTALAPVVLMVGHNPGIAEMAQALAHVAPTHPRWHDYPTGATAVIEFALPDWAEAAFGRGAVRDFVVPDDLEG